MALDLCQNLVSAQYLENKLTDFHQIIYIYIYVFILIRSRLGLLHMVFSNICTSVMTLDLCQNFVST